MLVSRSIVEGLAVNHRALLINTLQELSDADLYDVVLLIRQLVIPPHQDPGRVIADGALQPYAELLFRELLSIALASNTTATKRTKAINALEWAGFWF